jgi:hypothetical protein
MAKTNDGYGIYLDGLMMMMGHRALQAPAGHQPAPRRPHLHGDGRGVPGGLLVEEAA